MLSLVCSLAYEDSSKIIFGIKFLGNSGRFLFLTSFVSFVRNPPSRGAVWSICATPATRATHYEDAFTAAMLRIDRQFLENVSEG